MQPETRMASSNRIEINPEIMLGKPVIRGTRITVELLLRKLSDGATEASLIEAYPHLTHEDIMAAIAYAADTVAQETPRPANVTADRGRRAMRLLAHESCDAAITRALRDAGHDVTAVVDTLRGADDRTVLEAAMRERRFLLTEDKDFGELVFAGGAPTLASSCFAIGPPRAQPCSSEPPTSSAKAGTLLVHSS